MKWLMAIHWNLNGTARWIGDEKTNSKSEPIDFWLMMECKSIINQIQLINLLNDSTIRLETKSFRILPLTYATKYDMT